MPARIMINRVSTPPLSMPTRSHRMSDAFATKTRLDVNGRQFTYFSLDKLGKQFNIKRLPFSMKILLENLLRNEDGVSVTKASIEAVAQWDPKAEPSTEIAFMPARVVLQDFTGVPRSEERRVGKECVRTVRSGGSRYH